MEQTLIELPELMSVEQIAKYLGVSKNTAYTWCNSGEIPSFKVANTRRIRKSNFMIWLEKQEHNNK
ncbi:excisionase family DNA binding protein [Fontibacillus solani]|uniref:Excisionase family DNA binding protein n=1 Tax=Fontibacillus solani TaxID=1572857 RepID=A0A7W3SVM9_9BACL|nr:helix-turn-helix domain-containing protein [Fontibacillus solani]MBA9086984.1 excisionase family DNA binding protein [Fontibacillus solani]